MVGRKVAIVSDKPQTTRRAIRGVATLRDTQLVLVDLPGRPAPARRADRAHAAPRRVRDGGVRRRAVRRQRRAGRRPGRPLHRRRAARRRRAGRHRRQQGRPARPRAHPRRSSADAAALDIGDEIFPVSARTGRGVEALRDHLAALMPEGPFLFAAEDRSDQPREVLLAELVREQVLRRTFQEVPHAVEVVIDEVEEREDGLTFVRALVWVEAESQKGILIGAGGRMIKAVGTAARRELERELGTRVHLDLSVRVRRGWRGRRGAAGPPRASNDRRDRGHGRRGLLRGARQPAAGRLRPRARPPRAPARLLRGHGQRRRRAATSRASTAPSPTTTATPSDLGALRPRGRRSARATSSSRTSIYVGGGNTASLLAVWRAHGLRRRSCSDALAGGAVLCGVSAGMNCWFEASVTDSFGPALGAARRRPRLHRRQRVPALRRRGAAPPDLPPPGRRGLPRRLRGRRRRRAAFRRRGGARRGGRVARGRTRLPRRAAPRRRRRRDPAAHALSLVTRAFDDLLRVV